MKKHITILLSVLAVGMGAVAQTALYENFEGVSLTGDIGQLPTGWTVYSDNQSNADFNEYGRGWVVSTTEQEANQAAISISMINGSACDRWLVTPPLGIASGAYRLTFRTYSATADYTERLRVAISTTDAQKASFTTTLRDITLTSAGWQYVDIPLNGYAGQTVYIAFVNHGNGVFVFVDDVRVEATTTDAVAVADAAVPAFMPAGEMDNVRVTLRNMGTSVLQSVDYTYTIGVGYGSGSFGGLGIAPGATASVSVPVQVPQSQGQLPVAIYFSNPNGSADPDPADNVASGQATLFDPATAARRVSLLENFTTQQCGNCPVGHENIMTSISGAADRVALVCHHVGYGTDQFTIDASSGLLSLYPSGEYAPAMMLDRDASNFGGSSPVYGDNGISPTLVRQRIDAATLSTTDVAVSMENIGFNPQTRVLSVTVAGRFFADRQMDDPRLGLFLVEDSLVSYQSGADGNYRHDRVIRASLSDVWGDAGIVGSTAAGSSFSHTFTLTLPSTWRADHCSLVAFVAEHGSSNSARRVANAAMSGYISGVSEAVVGIAEAEALSVEVRPNPAAEVAYISAGSTIRSYEVYDEMGRRIATAQNVDADMVVLDVRGMAQGVCVVRLSTDRGPAAARVVVR